MRESSQLVRIERHRVEGELVVLTFNGTDEGGVNAEAVGGRPLVFVQHGLGSRKERHLDLCLRLTEAGFMACSLDARHHGDRATEKMRRCLSDVNSRKFLLAFAETVQGTVHDITAAATYFGARSYGLIGHSMGGFIALQTTMADPRVSVVVSIAGALTLAPPEGIEFPPMVAEAIRRNDPAERAAEFWPRPVLLLHGVEDKTVPCLGSVLLKDALTLHYATEPERLALVTYPGIGHELSPGMASAAVDWVRRFHSSGNEAE